MAADPRNARRFRRAVAEQSSPSSGGDFVKEVLSRPDNDGTQLPFGMTYVPKPVLKRATSSGTKRSDPEEPIVYFKPRTSRHADDQPQSSKEVTPLVGRFPPIQSRNSRRHGPRRSASSSVIITIDPPDELDDGPYRVEKIDEDLHSQSASTSPSSSSSRSSSQPLSYYYPIRAPSKQQKQQQQQQQQQHADRYVSRQHQQQRRHRRQRSAPAALPVTGKGRSVWFEAREDIDMSTPKPVSEETHPSLARYGRASSASSKNSRSLLNTHKCQIIQMAVILLASCSIVSLFVYVVFVIMRER